MSAPTARQLDVLRALNAGARLLTDDKGIGYVRLDITTLRAWTVDNMRDAGWIREFTPGIWALTEEGRDVANAREHVHDFITHLST